MAYPKLELSNDIITDRFDGADRVDGHVCVVFNKLPYFLSDQDGRELLRRLQEVYAR